MIAEHDLEILLQTGEPQFYDERPLTTPSGDVRIATTTRECRSATRKARRNICSP